jgi:hypothetical protein
MLSGSSLTPHHLFDSSIVLLVLVVDTALVSGIIGRVSLLSLSTIGSAAIIPETWPVTAR